jgi:mono/diheme cytochrome c family protein
MIMHAALWRTTLAGLAVVLTGAALVARQEVKNPEAAAIKNPVAATPESIAAGKRAYDENCSSCHGDKAQGAEKAKIKISIIEDSGGKQPPDLTDDTWDHGSTDGEIFTVIKKGLPPTMMAGWDGRIEDEEIWNIINYIRDLAKKK